MDPLTTGTLGGIALLLILELRKMRMTRLNGRGLQEIIKAVDEVKTEQTNSSKKLAEVATAVLNQKDHCAQTVDRFDKALRDQQKELLNQAKRKR